MDKNKNFDDLDNFFYEQPTVKKTHNKWPSGGFQAQVESTDKLIDDIYGPFNSKQNIAKSTTSKSGLLQGQYHFPPFKKIVDAQIDGQYAEDQDQAEVTVEMEHLNIKNQGREAIPDVNTSWTSESVIKSNFKRVQGTMLDDEQITLKGKSGGIFEEQNIKCSVEVKNGVPQTTMHNQRSSNALTLNQYNGITGFMVFMFDLLWNFEHGLLLAHWLIMVWSGANQIDDYNYIIAVTFISLFTRGAINLFHDKKLKEAADGVNQKPVEKFVFNKRRKFFQLLDWTSIQTGDIIKVKQNQEIPCDALILDIVGSKSSDQTCNMKGGLWDDFRNPTLKCSYQGTMNKTGTHISDSKFVDQISGLLKWEYNHFGFFTGSFKQIDSPAAFDITQDNILQRGCYFTQAQTIICLVLNVGSMTMGNNFRQDESKLSRINHWIRQKGSGKQFEPVYFSTLKVLQIASFLFCFIPVIMTILEDLILTNLPVNMFKETWHLNQEEGTGYGKERYWYSFAGFMTYLPYLSKFTMDTVIFFHAYFTMWDVNLVPAQLNFTNFNAMKSMGQVDSIVCSKSAFFSSHNNITAAFKIGNTLFQNKKTIINETIVKNGKGNNPYNTIYDENNSLNSGSDESDEDMREQLEYLPNYITFDPYFDCPDAQELISKEQKTMLKKQLRLQFEDFLTALVLCHNAVSNVKINMREETPSRQTYKSLYKDEESQLQLADSFDFQFQSRRKSLLTILKKSAQTRFKEIIIRRIAVGTDQITIQVVKHFTYNSGVTIYFKGRLSILKDFLARDIMKTCQIDIDKFMQQGIHLYGIGKYEMDSDAANDFIRCISENQSAYKGTKQIKNDKLLIQYAYDMQLVGVWGLKSMVNSRDSLVIEELKKNGVKLFLLNQDENTISLTDCYALEIFETYNQPLTVTGLTDRQVEESLKTNLKQVVERRTAKTPQNSPYPGRKSMMRKGEGGKNLQRKPEITPQGQKTAAKRSQTPGIKDFSDFSQFAEKNVVIFDGKALQFILKDETLLKLFLTLCNLSSLCIGSSINPYQKVMFVKAIRQFLYAGKQGTVVSVIGQQTDKFMISEADVSIGLNTMYRQSGADFLAQTDIQMKNMFGITYLLFKHGTLAHRRTKVVLDEFIYRTILTLCVQVFFFITNGFSFVRPYGKFFFPFFMIFLTPIQFWLEGISHTDYGYNIFHRIFGEYRHNQTQKLQIQSYIGVVVTAIVDACIFCLFYVISGQSDMDLQVTAKSSKVVSGQSYVCMNGILLSMMHFTRVRAVSNSIQIFNLSNFLFFLLSLAFVLEDEYLAGVQMLFSSANTMVFLAFAALVLGLQIYIKLVIQVVLPYNLKNLKQYTEIEDRLFMEEYEDPEQEFSIQKLPNYQALIKTLDADIMTSINQNLLKVHRTDSMDQIIARLNQASGQMTDSSGYINKFTLKLNDLNKELEYNQNNSSNKAVEHCIPMVWTSVIMYVILALFKMVNTIMDKNNSESEAEEGEATKEEAHFSVSASLTRGSTFQTSYFEIAGIFLSLVSIYLIKKVKSSKSNFIIFGLIIAMNAMIVIQFIIDKENPLLKISFLYTLAFSFGCRLSSFFFVTAICLCSTLALLNISLTAIQNPDQAPGIMHHKVWETIAIVIYLFQWVYNTYWDEIKRKIQFVSQYRKVKEFQKLKSIINILIPSLVRSRIQEGKKNFSEAQGEVTIIFIDINNFDEIVQTYTGRDLIELLDKAYNAFDQLCEQYGIQKIETVGKTYMACGGLKVCERDIDSRLLGSHHSVRVVDFAFVVQQYVNTVVLKNGDKLSVKIGIHTGDVISGVVGETKPQFSLIGDTVNKSSRVCAKCPKQKILISKETHQALDGNANNLLFQSLEVQMKGIGNEIVYTVQKRRTMTHGIRNQGTRNKIMQNHLSNRLVASNLKNQPGNYGKSVSSKNMLDEQKYLEDQDGGAFSNRSMISNDSFGMQTERKLMMPEESEQIDETLNDSFDDDGPNNLKYNDFKEDRQIIKSAAQNEKYKLVERPRFLLQLDIKDQEQQFFSTQWSRNLTQEITSFFLKCLLDIMVVQGLILCQQDSKFVAKVNIPVACLHIVLALTFSYFFYRSRQKDISTIMFFHVLSYIASIGLLIIYGQNCKAIFTDDEQEMSKKQSINVELMKTQQYTLILYVMTIFGSKGVSFRIFCVMTLAMFLSFIIQNYFYIEDSTINLQTFIVDGLLNIILAVFFILGSYNREMKLRKIYNNERIIEVEIDKTEELLNKLVPKHVLQGIKNDQKVVDLLENVTLLYTDMVGFTEFSKNVSKPQEVVTLLSSLFSKFDELCYQRKVYKVHTIGDCYVIMGYTGKVAKERRTLAVQIEEAYKVIQVGLEMIEIINEARSKTDNPALKNLDMRIGIHTGKIVGGIIGTKIVRYDIFGQDVLIANKMESNGQAGSVVISDSTYRLIKQNQWIFDIFDMQEHRDVQIGVIGKSIKSYKVEQIFAASYSSSNDSEEQVGEDHDEEDDDVANHGSEQEYDNYFSDEEHNTIDRLHTNP